MLFNSLQFAVFFTIVYSLYLILNHKYQNRMLLVASYIFYGAWDWRFLSLIIISTILDYICGLKIYSSRDARRRKWFLFLSVFCNLSILGFFKYFDFFSENLQALSGYFGLSMQPRFLQVILPIGISFYTFQTMSYTIDIYRGEMKPTRKFLDFALFVAFFPQLVAGPIERARNLLPQMLAPRHLTLDKFYQGCFLIFWGLFQKIFVADNLARIVDSVFTSSGPYNGAEVLLALYAFAFQILCDFAGYSNIARGLGKCMGFEIMVNFKLPYFARNPREFWHRWHISLSSWLRDYIYIPLGGSRIGSFKTYRNLAITMFLGGLWHGAAWNFVIWGVYQGLLLIIYRLLSPILKKIELPSGSLLKKIVGVLKIFGFFQLTCLGWLIFRARSIPQVIEMFRSIFVNFHIARGIGLKFIALHILLLVIIQFIQYWKKDLMALYRWPTPALAGVHALMLYLMLWGGTTGHAFIYFQF